MLVIDDLQWVDDESSRALLFALRRLRSEPVLVIMTSQPHTLAGMPAWARLLGDASQCRKVEVSGLKTAELIDLARVIGGGALDVDTAERLQQHTAGHPLHARALLAEFGVRRLADAPGVLPAPHDFALLIVAAPRRLATGGPRPRRGCGGLGTVKSAARRRGDCRVGRSIARRRRRNQCRLVGVVTIGRGAVSTSARPRGGIQRHEPDTTARTPPLGRGRLHWRRGA